MENVGKCYQVNECSWFMKQVNSDQFEKVSVYRHTVSIELENGNVMKYLNCGCSIRQISEHTYNRFRKLALNKILSHV